ncbi:MAG: sugar phosphate isomerase/epimerase [Alistipes sp.]|nr:sugar phosphate isomerase/epimerase [Alistipes sp.]
MLKHFLRFAAVAAMLMVGCSEDPTNENENSGGSGSGSGPAKGEITLQLGHKNISGSAVTWEADEALIINRKTYYVEMNNGKPVVHVEKAEDGHYEAFYPALLFDKSDMVFTLPFSQFYYENSFGPNALPMYGECKGGKTLNMEAMCGIIRLNVAGEGYITSIYVEDLAGGSIAGEFDFTGEEESVSTSQSKLVVSKWVTLNCAGKEDKGAALSSSGTEFNIVVPTGTYNNGFKIRISDRNHKKVEKTFGGSQTIEAGKILDLGTVAYEPDEHLLYAQHFDNCTWGGDIVAGAKGLGRGSHATDLAPKSASGTEIAVRVKNSDTPGAEAVTDTEYTHYTYNSNALNLSKAYMRNRGLDDWRLLFYAREFKGYICGGNPSNRDNRGIIRTPFVKNLGNTPCMAEISFRICLEKGFEGYITWTAVADNDGDKVTSGSGLVFLNYWVDGEELDINPKTSTRLSQASQARNAIIINKNDFTPGEWHDVKVKVGAFTNNTTLRFFPTIVRDANNVFYLDDFVVTRIPYDYDESDYTIVEPTTELGDPAEDVTRLRLRVGTTGSLTNDALFSGSAALGYTYISPGFGSKENAATAYDKWVASAEKGHALAEKHNRKIWCMHLPYGDQTEARYYDPCTPDEKERDSTVRYFSAIIRAARVLQPKFLLIHCNQTLQFNDGSNADNMARTLYQLQLVADEIGTQIAVENMSHGVGADSRVLAECVDKANAMTDLGRVKKPVMIAVDIGHANVYLSIVKDGRTVVDWLRDCGRRVGALHMHDNRGKDNDPTKRRFNDDHLYPGYPKTGMLYKQGRFGAIGENNLWGPLYHTLLKDCGYRGPFDFELSTRTYGTLSTLLGGDAEERTDQINTPWHASYIYDTYVYPAYRKYMGLE